MTWPLRAFMVSGAFAVVAGMEVLLSLDASREVQLPCRMVGFAPLNGAKSNPTPAIAEFRKLPASACFILPNPWDVGSARYLQHLGFKALATTSAGFAFSRGLP